MFFGRPRHVSTSSTAYVRHTAWNSDQSQIAVKFFHKSDDQGATKRTNMELITCLRLYHGLYSHCIDRRDSVDLYHLVRLHDVLVDAPIFEERNANDGGDGNGGGVAADLSPSIFRATVMVFEWVDSGDAHSLVRAAGGGIPAADGARLFWQVLRGLRALHRRKIVHRDVKVRVSGVGRLAKTAVLGR